MGYADVLDCMLGKKGSRERGDRSRRIAAALKEVYPELSEATLRGMPGKMVSGERRILAEEWAAIVRALPERVGCCRKLLFHIAGGVDPDIIGDLNGSHGVSVDSVEQLTKGSSVVAGYWGGAVEAGVFRGDAMKSVVEQPPSVLIRRDDKYPFAKHIEFKMRGDSMEGSRIFDGDNLECVEFSDSLNALHTGMEVIIERKNRDGAIERSAKAVMVFPDRIEFQPRSSNPRHQAIVMKKGDASPEYEIRVIAIVRAVRRKRR